MRSRERTRTSSRDTGRAEIRHGFFSLLILITDCSTGEGPEEAGRAAGAEKSAMARGWRGGSRAGVG